MLSFKQFMLESQFNSPSFGNVQDLQAQFDHLQENPNEQNIKDFISNWVKPLVIFAKPLVEIDGSDLTTRAYNRIVRNVQHLARDIPRFQNLPINELEADISYWFESLKDFDVRAKQIIPSLPQDVQKPLNDFIDYLDKTLPMLKIVKDIPSQLVQQDYPF